VTLDADLYAWALTRPWWQQQALGRLVAGHKLTDADLEHIADVLLADPPAPPDGGWLGPSLRPVPGDQKPVRLVAVRGVRNINALVDDQTLTFARDGLTVVYGANGSGKSGYARVVKRGVRSRHRDDILPDIFDSAGGASNAVIEYTVGETPGQALLGEDDAALAQVAFYDEKCGDCYVTLEADISYRPSGLTLLDALVGVCDGVRSVLDRQLAANAASAVMLPALPAGTAAAAFRDGLGASTTDEAIDDACRFDETAAGRLAYVVAEEARVRASDPRQEGARLSTVADALESVTSALTGAAARHGTTAERTLRSLLVEATEKRAAGDVASSATFEAEPVSGVGTQTWRTLWEAARAFCEQTAYPDRSFPITDADARCPLCQQNFDADAAARMRRFHAYMTDTTEREAEEAETAARRGVREQATALVLTPAVAVALATVRAADSELADVMDEALGQLDARRTALAALAGAAGTPVPAAPNADALAGRFTGAATGARDSANAIDSAAFTAALQAVLRERAELEARRALAETSANISAERDRMRRRVALEAARRDTVTTAITRESTDLTRRYVTTNVADRFSRESDRLGVERVALADTGGHKGQLRHKPAFLGATMRADLPRVLSEGEQTALGLAGFFTEAYFDQSRSALVLDDPVTSLDHLRRDKVANRLAALARDRQVIVFTHDTAFVTELRIAAREEDVPLAERTVARRSADRAPGICSVKHPWAVKDTRQRLDALRTDLARIKREHAAWDAATYEDQSALFAGRLSQTWERIISMEIANNLVDRGTLEVRVKMMKIVAAITAEDERQLQESYSRISRWAPRHDKDQSLEYSAPSVDELEAELTLISEWFDRVRKYGK